MTEDAGSESLSGLRRLLVSCAHRVFLLTRGMTLGVRGACFDAQGQVFLVRHTYVPGWYLPGGGVEHHQTAEEALARELREEGNLEIIGRPHLFQVYYQRRVSKRDHVILYRAEVRQTAPRKPDHEIRDSGFFAPDALPEGTTRATVRRLAEIRGEAEPSAEW